MIAGGMGSRAQQLFSRQNIRVITGAAGSLEDIPSAVLNGNLKTGRNVCDH